MIKIVFLCGLLVTSVAGVKTRQQTAQERSSLLAKTWDGMLEAGPATTPVTRAVNLLKEMSVTLQKDMDEDETLYKKLACWCTKNGDDKTAAIKANTDRVAELESTIEEKTASSGNLKVKVKELEGEVADNKDTLAKATALRQKEMAAFNGGEKDSVAAIANLKGAIVVLSKHHDAALPQLSAMLSFIQSGSKKDDPWGLESKDQRNLDMFMSDSVADAVDGKKSEGRFLQQAMPAEVQEAPLEDHWTRHEVAAVQSALHSASSFVQRRGQDASTYVPGYSAQSGEIFGILKTLQEEMVADLTESQKNEAKRAGDFADLRAAKSAEIEGGWKSSEEKEDELAKTDNDLAEAKEDLGQTKATLAEDTKFAENLKVTCDEADENFGKRKAARLAEMKAVSDTVQILSEEDAKDAMSGTFNKDKKASFIQLSSKSHSELRSKVAQLLRRAASRSNNAELALLATSSELNAFTKVKAMCDKMIEALTTQQADEVKKNDFCTSELQSNDMATAKANDLKADLDASAEDLKVTMNKFQEEITAAKTAINKEQVSLQKATENRKTENLDFQKSVADQMLTIKVLEKAMDRLATYYDDAALIQTRAHHIKAKQTPPVAQVKYEVSKASTGVISLIEKLIYDAKEISAESKKSESAAQKAYEELVADSNGTIKSLTKQVVSKTDAKVEAGRDLTQKNLDLKATTKDIGRLGKTDEDLHEDCDYVMKNFMVRQQARGEEVEALKQAIMILNGASAAA